MQISGGYSGGFEAKWRPALDEVARMLGLESLTLHRSDLSKPAGEDGRRLRFAIWVRGRQVGELVAVGRDSHDLGENPLEMQALFALREAIEEDLSHVAAVA